MIFLTGGTGLVGAHILLKLTESGQKVKALKRKRSSLTVIKNIFSHYKKTDLLKSIEWIEGDLLDLFSLQEGIKGCNTVIHCAAIVSFNPKDFKKVMNKNPDVGVICIEGARFVYPTNKFLNEIEICLIVPFYLYMEQLLQVFF